MNKPSEVINTVNVIKTNSEIPTLDIIGTFKANMLGNEQAEELFTKTITEQAQYNEQELTCGDIEDALDNGYFEDGGITIYITHSLNEF